MAITIFKQPSTNHINLLGLPISFELITNNLLLSGGEYAQYTYTIYDSFPTNGKILRIQFLNYKMEFACSDTPDYANNEISNSIDGSPTEGNDWGITVATELNLNPIIAEHWIVTGNGGVGTGQYANLTFTAKYMSGALVMPNLINESGYLSLLLNIETEGKTSERKPSFYIISEIYDHNNIKIDTLTHTPDQYGKVKYQIENILKKYIVRSLNTTNSLFGTDYITKFFHIQYYERWGENNSSPILSTPNYYYMYGGVGHLQQGIYNDHYMHWYDDLDFSKLLLTSRKTKSYAKIDQYLLFGFLPQAQYSDVFIYVKFYTKNGYFNTAYYNIGTLYINIAKYINISEFVSQWLAGWPFTLEKVEFYFSQIGMPQYTIHFLDYLNDGTEFIYKNNFGYYDSIIVTGFEIEKPEYDSLKTTQLQLADNYKSKERSISHQKPTVQYHYEANTGLISGNDLIMLKEMLMSDDVFVVKNSLKIPIIIEHSSIQTNDKSTDSENVKFKYALAHKENYPSNLTQTNIF